MSKNGWVGSIGTTGEWHETDLGQLRVHAQYRHSGKRAGSARIWIDRSDGRHIAIEVDFDDEIRATRRGRGRVRKELAVQMDADIHALDD